MENEFREHEAGTAGEETEFRVVQRPDLNANMLNTNGEGPGLWLNEVVVRR